MLRWKRGSLLTQKNYKKILRSESGITLVELLASLSLLMVIILLAGSIHIFGQRQFKSQRESATQANNVSYALGEMSSELRKYSNTDLTIRTNGIPKDSTSSEGNEIYLGDGDNQVKYFVENNKLKRNNTVIADSIDSLHAEMNGTFGIIITLTSDSKHSKPKEYETTITFRGVANAD